MPDRDPDIRVAIIHSIKLLSFWTIVLYLCVAVIGGSLFLQAKSTADRTHEALCTFVADLQGRIEQSQDFLAKHKGEKEPVPGVSRTDLRLAIQRQQDTLDSLGGLGCTRT